MFLGAADEDEEDWMIDTGGSATIEAFKVHTVISLQHLTNAK